jgi:23S rRNA pseudouridine2605 synthase
MIRLQKLLAGSGLGSRRAIEEWIRAGRLTIGGRTAQLGDRATLEDEIRLDGRRLELNAAHPGSRESLLYYKPLGEVTTRSDPQRRPTVFERLPPPRAGRWITVGRLDVNTSGLLLLTTDGELAHRLMHPSSEVEREYLVRVHGRPGPQILEQLLAGVNLEDGPGRFDAIQPADPAAERRDLSHTSYRVMLHEGRNREVRRLWKAVGFEVSRLLRIRYGPIELPRDMCPGSARPITGELLERLIQAAGGAAAAKPAAQAVSGPTGPGKTPAHGRRRRPGAPRGRPPSK